VPSLYDLVKDINGDIPIALVGHKPDPSGRRKITRKTARNLANQLEIPYFDTRNPSGPTLEPVLEELVPRMLGFAKY
jgi:methionyl-tRNA formyltransferase